MIEKIVRTIKVFDDITSLRELLNIFIGVTASIIATNIVTFNLPLGFFSLSFLIAFLGRVYLILKDLSRNLNEFTKTKLERFSKYFREKTEFEELENKERNEKVSPKDISKLKYYRSLNELNNIKEFSARQLELYIESDIIRSNPAILAKTVKRLFWASFLFLFGLICSNTALNTKIEFLFSGGSQVKVCESNSDNCDSSKVSQDFFYIDTGANCNIDSLKMQQHLYSIDSIESCVVDSLNPKNKSSNNAIP